MDNFPVIDGSDSTLPLRTILSCRLLGFEYYWIRDGIADDGGRMHVKSKQSPTGYISEHILKNNTPYSFQLLIDGEVDLIIVARSISREEKEYADQNGVTLLEKPIAKDALTFIVNLENPVSDLTIEQIQGIYMGNITNWSEVAGPNLEIHPYIRNRNSGSQEKFETIVMSGLDMKEFDVMFVGNIMYSPYLQIMGDIKGIGFTPFYYYNVIVNNGTTKAIGVNGVDMTKDNIRNNTYPLVTDVYAAVRADVDKNSMTYKIFEYLTESEGQSIVDESGYINLSDFAGLDMVLNDEKKLSIKTEQFTFNLY